MELSYNLIRIIKEVEADASASNDVRVSYTKPLIEVILGGVDHQEAESCLNKIEDEMKFLRNFQERRAEIRRVTKTRTTEDKRIHDLEMEIFESKHEYRANLHINNSGGIPYSYDVWRSIERRINYLSGEYLIIPGIYKNL